MSKGLTANAASAEGDTVTGVRLAPNEARKLLLHCFDEFAKDMRAAVATSLETTSDLFDAKRATTANAISEFRSRRKQWLDRFGEVQKQLFDGRVAGTKRKWRRPDRDDSLDTLSFLSDVDQEQQLALQRASRELANATASEVAALDLRIAELLHNPDPREYDNPFATPYVLDAVGAASRAVYPEPQVWRSLMERLAGDLMAPLNKIYIHLNRLLADRGVLPNIKSALRARSQHRPAEDKDLLPAFSKLMSEAGPLPTNIEVPPVSGDTPGVGLGSAFPGAAGGGTQAGAMPGFGGAAGAPAWPFPGVSPSSLPPGLAQILGALGAGPGMSGGFPGAAPSMQGGFPGGAPSMPGEFPGAAPSMQGGFPGGAGGGYPPGAGVPLGSPSKWPYGTEPGGGYPSVDPVGNGSPSAVLFHALNQWQQVAEAAFIAQQRALARSLEIAPQATAGGAGGASGTTAGAGFAPPVNQIPFLRTQIADKLGTAEDLVTVDVIGLLFDYIFRDPSIPDSLRNLFSGLQVPILKAALLDRDFFAERKHPARRLLDDLAAAAVGAGGDPEYLPSFTAVATEIVEEVGKNFDRDLSVFENAEAELRAFVDHEQQETDAAIVPDVDAALAAEERGAERAQVRVLVRDKLADQDVPFEIRTFLETVWADHLTALREKDGSPSAAGNEGERVIDDLLWSIGAKERTAQKSRLTAMVPGLIAKLRAGANATNADPERTKPFFELLYRSHMEAIRPPAAVEADAGAKPAASPSPTDSAPAALTTALPSNMNAHDFVTEMGNGTWIEFHPENDEVVEARLQWVSPMRTKYIFTSRSRRRALVFTPEELAWQLGAGGAKLIVEPVPLFDRAVSAALDSLAARVPPKKEGAAAPAAA